jgi:hypothetical protein
MFWRSADTPENIVPAGWTDFGGPHHFTECPNCRARDIRDIGLDEFMEDGRVDANLKHGSTGSSGTSDKPLRLEILRAKASSPRLERANKRRKLNEKAGLKRHASEIFKNHPEHLKAVLKQIDDDERKKRANAAESRKRKRTGGNRRRKKITRRRRKSKRRKRRRKKRTRRRR